MKQFYYGGANYIELEGDEQITAVPIELGDKLLMPGDWVNKIGEKQRSSFEMQEGFYLKYLGYVQDEVGKQLLFNSNLHSYDLRRMYYSFAYTDRNCLLLQSSHTGFWDIRVEKLEIFKNVEIVYPKGQQKFI